jgi:hypothetical protein
MNQPRPKTAGQMAKKVIAGLRSAEQTIEKIYGNQLVGTNHINTGHLGRE